MRSKLDIRTRRIVSSVAPSNPTVGMIWFNPDTNVSKTYTINGFEPTTKTWTKADPVTNFTQVNDALNNLKTILQSNGIIL